jgi:signal transduction histidine kinase
LQLTYEDNGKGFNTSIANKGIGLNSLGSRLEMVNGKIEFDDTVQTGIAAYIRIPI